jgi:UDP-2,4-diacetamido-2,4,6-trideoxy-beta-L-altropyranose hydrolase
VRIALRTDASTDIGTGHLMRCLALADALKSRRAEITFVSRKLPDDLRDLISQHGHGFEILPEVPAERGDELAHSAWLGTSQAADARSTLAALGPTRFDWLIVDHYALDHRWERIIRRGTRRIFAIDDLADRVHDCDVLLDQNFHPDIGMRYDGKVPSTSTLLLGPRYALLREEFAQLRASSRERDGSIRRVLVFFGGVDRSNYTQLAVEALVALQEPLLQADVVVGVLHPAIDALRSLCDQHGFRLHVQTRNMAELMRTADLAIGASGSASWERCCLRVPTICIPTALNQEPIARGLRSAGAALILGVDGTVSLLSLTEAVRYLLDNPQFVRDLSAAAGVLVDGCGATRVCQLLAVAK